MSVSPTSATANPVIPDQSTMSSGSGSASVDPSMFLKLLVAEIQNQDPTKPMGSSELVQQLSSFSQVQQSAETNSRLGAIMGALSLGQSAAIIGRGIIAADGTDLGVVSSVRYSSQGLVARIADGSEILLGEGVTVRA